MLPMVANYRGQIVMAQTPPNLELQSAALSQATPSPQRSLRLIIGIVLMASSFLVYPAYPVIILWLPISGGAKATMSVAVWVLSWSTFSLGAYLAGPQGYAWFKNIWQRLVGRRTK
jgi:hypothetical protein